MKLTFLNFKHSVLFRHGVLGLEYLEILLGMYLLGARGPLLRKSVQRFSIRILSTYLF